MDWKGILRRIRPCGKLCVVGLPPSDISFHARDIIMSQVSVCGSLIGNRAGIRDMLKFAQLHNIRCARVSPAGCSVPVPHLPSHHLGAFIPTQARGRRASPDTRGSRSRR